MSENDDLCFPNPRLDPCFVDQTALSKAYPHESQSFHPTFSHTISSEFKLSLPPSMETQIRKLKLSMEPWKELILHANHVLLWEKQWHSTALLAGSSTFFTILWLCDPNVLTVIALMGLTITLADYFLPILLSTMFKSESWTNEKQREYEEICTNIILYKTKAELIVSSYCRMRVTNPKLYFSITIFTLCLLTWLGGSVDNLFLTFLFVTFIIMFPGMQCHGKLNKFSETFSKLFNDLVENAKSKVAQKKTQ